MCTMNCTENYWRAMSNINATHKFSFDDQVRLNYALKRMNPVWEDSSGRTAPILNTKATLTAHASGFTVTLLPAEIICRSQCREQLQSHYYVWHKQGSKNVQRKTNTTGHASLWFLRKEWEICNSSASGVQWLEAISDS